MMANSDYKILIIPGELNNTPHNEDLLLLVSQEEFIRMWQRGQDMLKGHNLKGIGIDGRFVKGSFTLS
jgi:hypothetical protein